jgi:hypothetical protein
MTGITALRAGLVFVERVTPAARLVHADGLVPAGGLVPGKGGQTAPAASTPAARDVVGGTRHVRAQTG